MLARACFGLTTVRRTGYLLLLLLFALSLAAAAGLQAATPAAPAGTSAKNPFEGNAAAIKEGEQIFDAKCQDCHMDGTGGAGPNLTDDEWIYGGSDAEVFETIAGGRKGGMPSWRSELGEEKIWKVIAFIRSIHRK